MNCGSINRSGRKAELKLILFVQIWEAKKMKLVDINLSCLG
jgi:hypothetical protein